MAARMTSDVSGYIGRMVRVSTTDGSVISGTLYTRDPESGSIVLLSERSLSAASCEVVVMEGSTVKDMEVEDTVPSVVSQVMQSDDWTQLVVADGIQQLMDKTDLSETLQQVTTTLRKVRPSCIPQNIYTVVQLALQHSVRELTHCCGCRSSDRFISRPKESCPFRDIAGRYHHRHGHSPYPRTLPRRWCHGWHERKRSPSPP